MKTLRNTLAALAGAMMLCAPIAQAGTFTINFFVTSGYLSGGTPPVTDPTQPFASATFTDLAPGQVTLSMSVSTNMTDGFVNDWWFNTRDEAVGLMPTHDDGAVAKTIQVGADCNPCQPNNPGGTYDGFIGFYTGGDPQIVPGGSSTYLFTATGLTVDDFFVTSVDKNDETFQGFIAAIHVQGYDGESSKWGGCVAGETDCGDTPGQGECDLHPEAPECQPGVPEPFTLAIFGTGLLGMAITRRRRGKW